MFNRVRWKPLASLTAILFVGAVASCLILRKAQERKPFVDKTDPVSGTRCRITVSSGWRLWDGWLMFDPPSRSIQRWLDSDLLHRPTPYPSLITLDHYFVDGSRGICLRDGYPELKRPGRIRILVHRHLRIHGYSATLLSFDGFMLPPPFHIMCLFVYAPNSNMVYKVEGYSAASHAAQLDDDMQSVISSFYIEKVAVHKGGKR